MDSHPDGLKLIYVDKILAHLNQGKEKPSLDDFMDT